MTTDTNPHAGVSSLADCLTDQMTPPEAAVAVEGCWAHAEAVLAPVVGSIGMGVLFRRGVQAAIDVVPRLDRPDIERSMAGFGAWVRGMEATQALSACRAFLEAVESYLLALAGEDLVVRWLGPARHPA
jgi:hypothetical protein